MIIGMLRLIQREPRGSLWEPYCDEKAKKHICAHTLAMTSEKPQSRKGLLAKKLCSPPAGSIWGVEGAEPLMTGSKGQQGKERKGKEEKSRRGGRWGRVGGGRRRREKKKTPELKKQKQNWAHQQRFLISCQNVARSALQLLLSTPPNPPHTSPVPLYTNKPEIILISGREVCWTEKQEVKDLGLRCTIKTHHTHGH